MKKRRIIIILSILSIILLTACNSRDKKEKVVIYSSTEDFNNELLITRLEENFPELDIDLQYNSGGESFSRLYSEGEDSPCDIVYGLEPGPLKELEENLVDVSLYDSGLYLDEFENYNPYFLINQKFSNLIIVNEDLMKEFNLPYPESYEDLLDPIYKNHIIFPNPKLSTSGYAMVDQIFDMYGEEKAIKYFDKFDENVREYVSSGSTTCKDVGRGEVAIGFAVTYSTLLEMDKGAPIKMISPKEGAPVTINGLAMTKKGSKNESVKEVFKYMADEFLLESNQEFFCEQVFKDHDIKEDRMPENLTYYRLKPYTMDEKKSILERWNY